MVNAGRVDVASEAPLGSGRRHRQRGRHPAVHGQPTTTRTFTLNSGTLEVPTGVTLTLNGAAVNGGFLASGGTGNFVLTGNAAVNGSTLFGGTTVDVTGPATLTNTSPPAANLTVARARP